MSEVTRLPVQHRREPHCPECDRQVTIHHHFHIMLPADEPMKVTKLVASVVCPCGKAFELSMGAGRP